MKKLIFIGVLLLLFVNFVNAAYVISPEMIKERYGFETIFIDEEGIIYDILEMNNEERVNFYIGNEGENYVVLNNDVKCGYYNFISGNCGNEFLVDCVPDGEHVWQFEECCEGKSYLPYGFLGQPSCRDFIYRFKNDLKYNPLYWLISLVILVGIIYLIYKNVKKK